MTQKTLSELIWKSFFFARKHGEKCRILDKRQKGVAAIAGAKYSTKFLAR